MERKFDINSNIAKAETLPARFYRDTDIFEALREKVFYRTWQWVGTTDQVPETGAVYPFTLLPQYLDEPIVLTRDSKGAVHC
ncbi:MAG: aromatic ring-hydroxylating dioxygenase subunit alpha, partial [Bacteroidia bacterium]|nr:aromatic ring-hydroxylating dioxygenase subunit alpha [Bacteroidia bacterium]